MAGVVSTVFLVLVGVVFMVDVSIADTASVIVEKYTYGVKPYNPEGKPLTLEFWVEISKLSDSSLKNLQGTGLWKLSLQASEEKVDTVNAEQVLSAEESSKGLKDGEILRVTSEPTAFNGMGGCTGDKKFICFKLSKGDNPDPDFDLHRSVSGCLNMNFPCNDDEEDGNDAETDTSVPDHLKSVNIKQFRYGVEPYNPEGKPFTVEFWVEINEWFDNSRKNLQGTGLWKLSLHASEEKVETFEAEHEQVLSAAESGKGLIDGGILRVTSEPTAFNGMGGCTGEKKFICFKLSEGDTSDPDFDLKKPVSGCLDFKFTCKDM